MKITYILLLSFTLSVGEEQEYIDFEEWKAQWDAQLQLCIDILDTARNDFLEDWDGENRSDYLKAAKERFREILQNFKRMLIKALVEGDRDYYQALVDILNGEDEVTN